MAPARLILIRHGNTASNGLHPDPKMSGWTDFPLSEIGHRQAAALRERLGEEPAPAAIYSSPLQRAQETAFALRDLCPEPIRVVDDLREVNCGAVDGMSIEFVKRNFSELWEQNMRQEDPDFRWPGGESYRELRGRSLAALDRISLSHPDETVLVVTHCGLISQVAGSLKGESPACWERYRVENCSLTELRWSPSHRTLVELGDQRHLSPVRDFALV